MTSAPFAKKPLSFAGAAAKSNKLSAAASSSATTTTTSSSVSSPAAFKKKAAASAESPLDPDQVRERQLKEQQSQRQRELQAMLKKQQDDKERQEQSATLAQQRAAEEKEQAKAKYRAGQKQAAEESVEKIVDKFKGFKKLSLKQLALEHGPFFTFWYMLFTTVYTLMLTALLHFKVVSFLESSELADRFGVKERFETISTATRHIGPITLSGRFFANYIVVSAILAPFIPVKLSAALATYPFALRYSPRWLTAKRTAVVKKTRTNEAY